MATVYLSPSGSDSNSYAQAQNPLTPWASPNKVQSSATTGDTVIVASGTYTIATSTTFSKSFTWVAVENGLAVFDFANVNYRWEFQAVQNMTGIKFYRGKHNTAYGCIFIHTANNGITHTFESCVWDTMLLNAYIANFGGVLGSNNCTGIKYILRNCIIKNITYDTVQAGTCLFAFRNANSTSGIELDGTIIYLPSTTNAVEKILNDGGSASKPVISGDSAIIKAMTAVVWGATGATLTYSWGYNITSFPSNTGNQTSDPLWVDPDNGNFNLQMDSPCIGGGIP